MKELKKSQILFIFKLKKNYCQSLTRFGGELSVMAWLEEFVNVNCALLPGQSKPASSKEGGNSLPF